MGLRESTKLVNTDLVTIYLFYIMVLTDAMLTYYAMTIGGYYETNNFTNKFGLVVHAGSIISLSIIAVVCSKDIFKKVVIKMHYPLMAVWVINNIISVVMLR